MMKNITDSLKNLTPQQKIDFLQEALEKEKKEKKKKQIFTLIEEAQEEQLLIEESIRNFEAEKPKEEVKETPLENIVTEAPELESKNNDVKLQDMYGMEKLETKYLAHEEREKDKYSSEPQGFSEQRFTEEERKKLKKQEEDVSRRSYHSSN